MKNKENIILQLQTFPACDVTKDLTHKRIYSSMPQYRKELIKTGSYKHPSTGVSFEVTPELLAHWVTTFNRYLENGSRVPVPIGHERDDNAAANAGWVTDIFVEEDSLFGIMELVDPNLALITDVSICIEAEVEDGLGNKYESAITHVALTTHPVIVGLEGFKKLSLSLSEGKTSMDFLKKLATKLGIKDAEPTEDAVMLALETKKLDVPAVPVVVLPIVIDPLAKLVSDNRAMKLSQLIKAGLITPAVSTLLTEKYVKAEAVALELSKDADDGFDTLYNVLVQNRPVKLDEVTGVQSLELANQSAVQPNAMNKEIAKRRTAVGLKN